MNLANLYDDLVTATHPDDAKALITDVLNVGSQRTADDPDPKGLLGDLFDAVFAWRGDDVPFEVDDTAGKALHHLVGLGYDPVPVYGPIWKD